MDFALRTWPTAQGPGPRQGQAQGQEPDQGLGLGLATGTNVGGGSGGSGNTDPRGVPLLTTTLARPVSHQPTAISHKP